MRKSIYYLLANVFSAIGALIYICVLNNINPTRYYPYYTLTGQVFANETAFEPFKWILLVLATSIIFCAQDCVAASNGKVKFEGLKNAIGGVVTGVIVIYTWVSIIFLIENVYTVGSTISLPLWLILTYVGAVLLLCLLPVFNKISDDLSLNIFFSAILLMFAGFINQVLCADYWWVALITYGSVLLIFVIILVIQLLVKNHKQAK